MKSQKLISVFLFPILIIFLVAACSPQPGIQGLLKDQNGQPLTSNITVTLKPSDAAGPASPQNIAPDSQGVYQFGDQPSGHYTLSITWSNNPDCPKMVGYSAASQIDNFLVVFSQNPLGNALVAVKEFDYKKGQGQKFNLHLPCSGPASAESAPSNNIKAGDVVANLTLSTYDNHSYSLSDFKGKVLLINFFSSWAIPSGDLTPILQQVWQKYQNRNVAFLGVAYNDRQSDAIDFAKKYAVTFPIGPDVGSKLSKQFNVTGAPDTIIIDQSGNIVNHVPGTQDITIESLSKIIDDLIK